ncbi:MAG TPA: hypothetical protein VGF99_15045 [Myxococcota bacterium]
MSGSGTNVGSVEVTIDGDAKPVTDAFGKASQKVDDFSDKLKKTSDAASRVTGRVDELRAKQEQLTRALVEAAGAADRDNAKVNALRHELEATTGALNRLTNAQQVSVSVQQKIATTTAAATGSTRNLGGAVLELSRGFEDAQYGMAGVLNNIPSLVTQLGGGMGLAGVISVVAVSLSIFIKHWDDFAPAVSDAVVAARAHVESFDNDLKRLKSTMDTVTGRQNKADEKLIGALTGITDDDARTIRAVRAEADGLEMELRSIGALDDPGLLGRLVEEQHITDARNKLKELRTELKELDAAFKAAHSREGWTGRGLDLKADGKADKAAEKADQKASDRAVTLANKAEAAFQRQLKSLERAGDRLEKLEGRQETIARDAVYALGFDGATMTVIGNHAAALILSAQANNRLASEFPDPGEAPFDLPPGGLQLRLDDGIIPAFGLKAPSVLDPSGLRPFAALQGKLEGLSTSVDAGAAALNDFATRVPSFSKAIAQSVPQFTRDDLVSIAAGALSAGSVGGIASAFGAGPIGMLFDAIVGAIREGMSLVVGEVSELVGDQRFASASESSVDPLMSGLTTTASMGTASPGLAVVAGPIAVAGAAAEFAWSLSMATKSSERFQGGMSVVVDRMVEALEPLWAGMLPLVGVFDMMATAAMPLLSAFAAQVPAAVESFFPAIQLMVVGFATITWITGVVGNGLIDFAQVISFFNDDAQATLERMKFNTEALWAAREDAQAMTWESAGAAGEASAALWELADAAEGASANFPTGYRVPLYDAERPDGRGSGTIINLYGGITLQPTTPDLARALREGVMAARGRNVWQSGGEDDDTN